MSILAAQEPVAFGSLARWPILPSLPTTLPSRANSLVIRSLSSTTSLKASAISPSMPVKPIGNRTEKSPLRKARRAASRSWLSRSLGIGCAFFLGATASFCIVGTSRLGCCTKATHIWELKGPNRHADRWYGLTEPILWGACGAGRIADDKSRPADRQAGALGTLGAFPLGNAHLWANPKRQTPYGLQRFLGI